MSVEICSKIQKEHPRKSQRKCIPVDGVPYRDGIYLIQAFNSFSWFQLGNRHTKYEIYEFTNAAGPKTPADVQTLILHVIEGDWARLSTNQLNGSSTSGTDDILEDNLFQFNPDILMMRTLCTCEDKNKDVVEVTSQGTSTYWHMKPTRKEDFRSQDICKDGPRNAKYLFDCPKNALTDFRSILQQEQTKITDRSTSQIPSSWKRKMKTLLEQKVCGKPQDF